MIRSPRVLPESVSSWEQSVNDCRGIFMGFRVGLEAIANAVRHARATRIGVTAEYTINALILTVEDNGIGFVLDEVSDSFGLRGMKKRLESVGGTIQISSEPGVGTRIEAVVPLPRSYRFGFPSFGRGTKQSQEQSPILT